MSIKNRVKKSVVLTLGVMLAGSYMTAGNVYANEKEESEVKKNEIVTTQVLNVRKDPTIDAEKIGALYEGTVIEILENKDGWNRVKLSEEEEGWVSDEFTEKEYGKVTVSKLNLREENSTESEKLGFLVKDDVVRIVETQDDWYKIEFVDEEEIKELEEEAKAKEEEAKKADENKEDKKEDSKVEEKESDEDKEEEEEKITGWVSAEYVLTESDAIELEKQEEARKAEEAKQAAEAKKTQNQVVSSSTTNKKPSQSTSSNSNSSSNNTNTTPSSGRTLTVNASAYSGHGITSTGTVPKWGTIAVDPTVIPYGTKVYIPMFDMVFTAEDTGSAIKGNKIDIFMNSSDETYNFGRRNIEIQILG